MHEKPTYDELEQRVRDLELVESKLKLTEEQRRTTLESIGDGFFAMDRE